MARLNTERIFSNSDNGICVAVIVYDIGNYDSSGVLMPLAVRYFGGFVVLVQMIVDAVDFYRVGLFHGELMWVIIF